MLFFVTLFLPVLGLRCWVGFLQLQWGGLFSSCGARASYCSGFSFCGAQVLGCMGFSTCGSWAVEHRLIVVVHECVDLPGSRIEPMSPALAGRFLSTAPPGKPTKSIKKKKKKQKPWFFCIQLVLLGIIFPSKSYLCYIPMFLLSSNHISFKNI